MKKIFYFTILWFWFLALPLLAETEIPNYQGLVNDFAGLLRGEEIKRLEDKLVNLKNNTTAEVAILTINKLKDEESIGDYALRVAEKWKVGKADKDNGVLIVASREDRQIFIATGYGIEPVLTDGECGAIYRNIIKPKFKEEKYFDGFDLALEAITKAIQSEFTEKEAQKMSGELPANLLILMIILFIVAALAGTLHYLIGGVVGAIGLPLVISYFYPLGLVSWFLLGLLGFVLGAIVRFVFEIASEGTSSSGGLGGFSSSRSSSGSRNFSFGGGSFGGGGAGGGW